MLLGIAAACRAGQEGLEPPTDGLEIRCSIRLSYCPRLGREALCGETGELKEAVLPLSKGKLLLLGAPAQETIS